MVWFLARGNLRRAFPRTALLVTGVAVAGALLFDMSMLGGGLERSFASTLGRLGYEIRVVLRGTLPLSTDVFIPNAGTVARRIADHPDVVLASPVIGTNLYVQGPRGRTTAVALGLGSDVTGIVTTGDRPSPDQGLIINRELAVRTGVAPGRTLRLETRISPQTGLPQGTLDATVAGIGEFVFDLERQRTLTLPLATLQRLLGVSPEQGSFIVVKVRSGTDPEGIARWINAAFPNLEALSIPTLLDQVRRQLTYFNDFAVILTGVSLLVALLLIGAVLTLAVGERLGEIATLRALGLSQPRLILLILLEGLVLAAISTPLALLLGAAVSRPLDAILRATPGMPQDLHFFVMTPEAVLRTVLLLFGAGTAGAVYPAWIAGRLNITGTLHQEVQ